MRQLYIGCASEKEHAFCAKIVATLSGTAWQSATSFLSIRCFFFQALGHYVFVQWPGDVFITIVGKRNLSSKLVLSCDPVQCDACFM